MNLRQAYRKASDAEVAETEITNYINGQLAGCPPIPFKIGKNYMIRTVTMANVGKVTAIVGKFIVMSQASWIADTGKWATCLRTQDAFKEVEPFADEVYINVESIVDATPFNLKLPVITN